VDPDIGLIAAYLSRELTPIQIVAVQDRLASDAAFRGKAAPIMKAWLRPGSFSSAERGGIPVVAEPIALAVEQSHPHRRVTVQRIAALIALVVLPVLTFAQLALYRARHSAAPGPAGAQAIGSPLIEDRPVVVAQPSQPPTIVEGPLGRTPHLLERMPASAGADSANSGTGGARSSDKAAIAALVREQQPAVVRGEAVADYVVLALNASGQPVWSTHGRGGLMVQVGRGFRVEIAPRDSLGRPLPFGSIVTNTYGPPFAPPRLMLDGVLVPLGVSLDSLMRLDIASVIVVRGASADSLLGEPVTGKNRVIALFTKGWRRTSYTGSSAQLITGGRGNSDAVIGSTTGIVMYVVGSQALDVITGSNTLHGWLPSAVGSSGALNAGLGLQPSGSGRSGIIGLPSEFVTSTETYIFDRGELAPHALRVLVVHLTADAVSIGPPK
jgi:hypothetical protein